jgi:hypothetical protein
MDLQRFRPRDAVHILLADESVTIEESFVLKTWALGRLLAWTILNQKKGKRRPKAQSSTPDERPARPKISTRRAKEAGHLILACLLHRRLNSPREPRVELDDDGVLKETLWLFLKSGGFAGYLEGFGPRILLADVEDNKRELRYVYRITEYMCRYSKFHGEDDKDFSIESAKVFVEKDDLHGGGDLGNRSIADFWEKYKNAAPYILATYRFLSPFIGKAKSVGQVVDFLRVFVSDQKRLDRVIGRAAFAADVLSRQARKVRIRDFSKVSRSPPRLRPFDDDEEMIIKSIDRKASIGSDKSRSRRKVASPASS